MWERFFRALDELVSIVAPIVCALLVFGALAAGLLALTGGPV